MARCPPKAAHHVGEAAGGVEPGLAWPGGGLKAVAEATDYVPDQSQGGLDLAVAQANH